MQDEDLTDIVNFISLQTDIKNKKKIINEKKNEKNNDDDDDDDNLNLLYPAATSQSEPSTSIESEPTKDIIKNRLTRLQAPKSVPTTIQKTTDFSGSFTPTQMAAMGYGTNTIQSIRNRGTNAPSTNLPFASPTNALRAMVNNGSLTKMPIAASYDPFSTNKEEINENVKMMRQKVLALLKKEPHKTEINKMRDEITGE